MNRNHGIDLLKVLAMLMVVTHHIMMASGAENAYGGMGNFLLQSVHSFCYCAVDCFVMATGYVMCQKEWKWQRIVKLWRQIVGYSLVLVVIGLFVLPRSSIGWRDWLYAVCPIATNRYWFMTQYFALFFAMPFLNVLCRSLTVQDSRNLVVGGFVLLTVFPFLAGSDLFCLKWGYCFAWFCYLYLAGAHIRNYGLNIGPHGSGGEKESGQGWVWVGALVIFSILSGSAVILGKWFSSHYNAGSRIAELGYSYASPLILLEAICMIVFFEKIKVRNERFIKLIAAIAPSIFIVYVVHSNFVFRHMVGWSEVFLALSSYNVLANIGLSILIAALLFIVIASIDWARRFIIMKWHKD